MVRFSAAVLAFAVLNPLQALTWSSQEPPAPSPDDELRIIHAAPTAAVPDPIRSQADALRRLRRAITANDLTLFRSLLTSARSFAEAMPIGKERNALRSFLLISADLETIWSYATSQSFGSFYDDESLAGFHDHLSADYPGYARFIDQYRVIDATGRILYPTAETRSFLLQKLDTLSFPPAIDAQPRRSPSPSTKVVRKTAPANHRVSTPHAQPKKVKTKTIAKPLRPPTRRPLPPKP